MKNKAFTLIELLGVIVILGILTLISFPPILNQIKKSKNEIKNSTKILIIDSAKDYYEDNRNNYDTVEGLTYCIDINTLTTQGYLSEKIKDENINDISKTKKIKMMYHNSKFDYDVTDTCNNNSLTRNNIEVQIVTEGKGLYKSQTEPDRYIYRGGDEPNSKVNNFIKLKENGTEVTYRILSFEPDETIKVIRDESIDNIPFDTTSPRQNTSEGYYCTSREGCNVWGNQSNTYYNGKTLTELNQDFYFYYYPNNESKSMEKWSIKGLVLNDATLNTKLNTEFYNTLDFKDKIDTHSFNVGGIFYYNGYSGGDKGLLKEKQEEQSLTWNGKIALMNFTEYIESSLNSMCSSVWATYYYNPINLSANYEAGKGPCALQNWNYKNNREWTISSNPYDSNTVWNIGISGVNNSGRANQSYGVRPSFYLKADVTLTGEGTESKPYKLAGA